MNDKLRQELSRLEHYEDIMTNLWRKSHPDTVDFVYDALRLQLHEIRAEIRDQAIITQSHYEMKEALDEFQRQAWLIIAEIDA